MFQSQQKLDLTPEGMAVIEAALATQAKILSVQADAGGSGARRRLNEVKKVITQIDQQRPAKERRTRRSWLCWFSMARSAG